jgi:hypothetical protein
MAAITAYSYTVNKVRTIDASSSFREVLATIHVGDGAKTYPANGLAFDKASLGFSTEIESIQFLDSMIVGGYFPRYNVSSGKVQLLDNAGTEIATSVTPDADLRVLVRGY